MYALRRARVVVEEGGAAGKEEAAEGGAGAVGAGVPDPVTVGKGTKTVVNDRMIDASPIRTTLPRYDGAGGYSSRAGDT